MCLSWKPCGHAVDVPFGDLMGLRAPARTIWVWRAHDTELFWDEVSRACFFPAYALMFVLNVPSCSPNTGLVQPQ